MSARGGRVARYDSAVALRPSSLEFSGDGDIEVRLIYVDDPAFAKGGLVDKAEIIKKAGRHGDTEIVHVNKEELEELRQMWGEPTINPETGCPEYFLKKVWKGIKKIAKPLAKIAPIAAMFIPGIGPLAAAAIGAASGGITGGLKGAVLGGVTGGLGASGALGKAVGSVAPGLSPVAQRAVTGGLTGALSSAASGGNVLNGALLGAGTGAAIGPGGLVAKGPTALPTTPASTPPATQFVSPSNPLGIRPMDTSQLSVNLPETRSWANRPFLGISDKIPNKIGAPIAGALALSALKPSSSGAKVQDFRNATSQELVDAKFQPIFKGKLPEPKGMFANLGVRPRDYGTIDEQYRAGFMPEQPMFQYVPEYAEGGEVKRDDDYPISRDFDSTRRAYDYLWGGAQPGQLPLEVRVRGGRPSTLEAMEFVDAARRILQQGNNIPLPREMLEIGIPAEREGRRLKDLLPDLATSKAARRRRGYGSGGDVDVSEFAVRGDGDGREDMIDAKLSDGEYVIDAETVALLGNGSSKAGAKALDSMRVNLRRHKGRSLAKGKFSGSAKAPESYMRVKHGR